ncbi:hypothetical protein BD324DRAFT_654155 [Kockovaella imperatae]|uniref:F-box domain-containing protein n=1 Tax=Kockovaella imperatae TaxID=4999 RepID=A0A1Y1U5Y9_9TREE|nr:hypothetical protein BD324DRAFT_654155 [Kockovaella imperatae]ORX33443.1 hypothetical protein BD324DRAFT_654155 [Kockovaella imperatae]
MSDWQHVPTDPPPPYSADVPSPAARQRYRTDPRLTPRHRIVSHSRGIPFEVLTLLCRYLTERCPSLLVCLSLTCKRIYQVVLPHLYHTIRIDRSSFPKLLHGVHLPSPPNLLSFRLDGTLPPEFIPSDTLKRRTEAFRLVETVVVEGFVPDIWHSESVTALHPGTILFPQAKSLFISAETLMACIHWEMVGPTIATNTSHPFLGALKRIVKPGHVEITSGIWATASLGRRLTSQDLDSFVRSGKKLLKRLFNSWKLDKLVFHGLTNEWMICADDCKRVVLHYVSSGRGEDFSNDRVSAVQGALEELNGMQGTRLVIVGSGESRRTEASGHTSTSLQRTSAPIKPDIKGRILRACQASEVISVTDEALSRIQQAGPSSANLVSSVKERIDCYVPSEINRLPPETRRMIGLGPRCDCYRPKDSRSYDLREVRPVLIPDPIDERSSTIKGVGKFVWVRRDQ